LIRRCSFYKFNPSTRPFAHPLINVLNVLNFSQPTSGEVRINPKCRVAMVNQHHADQLDLSLSPLAFMRRRFPGDGSYDHDQRLRSHLVSVVGSMCADRCGGVNSPITD
jgi:hypothetical protein